MIQVASNRISIHPFILQSILGSAGEPAALMEACQRTTGSHKHTLAHCGLFQDASCGWKPDGPEEPQGHTVVAGGTPQNPAHVSLHIPGESRPPCHTQTRLSPTTRRPHSREAVTSRSPATSPVPQHPSTVGKIPRKKQPASASGSGGDSVVWGQQHAVDASLMSHVAWGTEDKSPSRRGHKTLATGRLVFTEGRVTQRAVFTQQRGT